VCHLLGYSRLLDVFLSVNGIQQTAGCMCEWDAALYWMYVCHLLGYSRLLDVFLSVNGIQQTAGCMYVNGMQHFTGCMCVIYWAVTGY